MDNFKQSQVEGNAKVFISTQIQLSGLQKIKWLYDKIVCNGMGENIWSVFFLTVKHHKKLTFLSIVLNCMTTHWSYCLVFLKKQMVCKRTGSWPFR